MLSLLLVVLNYLSILIHRFQLLLNLLVLLFFNLLLQFIDQISLILLHHLSVKPLSLLFLFDLLISKPLCLEHLSPFLLLLLLLSLHLLSNLVQNELVVFFVLLPFVSKNLVPSLDLLSERFLELMPRFQFVLNFLLSV